MMGRRGVVEKAGEVLVGGSQVLLATVTAPLGRGRYNRWGASETEVAQPMPGDELVTEPQLGYTRAITIHAPPERVWAWLAQIGHGRGGLYSFDALENLVGCQIRSVEAILAEYQEVAVGDLIRMGPTGYPCFRVTLVDPPQHLVLVGADPKPPHGIPGPEDPAGVATWQWSLRPTPGGSGTRLVVRQRLTHPPSHVSSVMWHLIEPIAFVMERQMLLGIKQRSETQTPA